MSDTSQGPGWWMASDNKWYPPELAPQEQPQPQVQPLPAYPYAAGHPPAAQVQQHPVTVSPWGRLGAYLLESLLITVTLVVGWLIWAAIIASQGQTPAKRILGHRVVMQDTGQTAGFARMFWVRGLLAGLVASVAIPITLGILLFMPFWDKTNQNLWDKVSGTRVVPS